MASHRKYGCLLTIGIMLGCYAVTYLIIFGISYGIENNKLVECLEYNRTQNICFYECANVLVSDKCSLEPLFKGGAIYLFTKRFLLITIAANSMIYSIPSFCVSFFLGALIRYKYYEKETMLDKNANSFYESI
jgi:hypothetical protein